MALRSVAHTGTGYVCRGMVDRSLTQDAVPCSARAAARGYASSIAPAGRAYYFFIVTIIIRHKTLSAAGWALLLIVRAFFNDAVTVAVWTGLHVCLLMDTSARLSRTTRLCHT